MENFKFDSKSAIVGFALVIIASTILTIVASVLDKQLWYLPLIVLVALALFDKIPPEKGKTWLWYAHFLMILLSGGLLYFTGQRDNWILPLILGLALFLFI